MLSVYDDATPIGGIVKKNGESSSKCRISLAQIPAPRSQIPSYRTRHRIRPFKNPRPRPSRTPNFQIISFQRVSSLLGKGLLNLG